VTGIWQHRWTVLLLVVSLLLLAAASIQGAVR
jgi:hypothetical protein